MAEQTLLEKQGIIDNSNELSTLSSDIAELCKVMNGQITSLKEEGAFRTVDASEAYFLTIDEIYKEVPTYAESILKFSEFLSGYVLKNYDDTDREAQTEIKNDLNESVEQINSVNELGNGVNLDRISTSAQGALKEEFVKVNRDAFQEGELEFKLRDDGTIQIMKNGTTLGFTTQDSVTGENISSTPSTPVQAPEQAGNVDVNSIAEASTVATGGIAVAASSQPTPTITPSSGNTNFVGYTGELHTKAKASDDVKASAGTITTGHQNYTILPDDQYTGAKGTISQSDVNLLIAQVAGEGANTKDDMLGVTCTVLNRLEAGGYGNSVNEVLKKGYFPFGESYRPYVEADKSYTTIGVADSAGKYASTEWGQEKLQKAEEVVMDALSGARNVESDVFYYSGNGEYNKFSDNL